MKLIDDATKIRIPKDSIIAMTGLQGEEKHFLQINISKRKILFVMMNCFGMSLENQGKKKCGQRKIMMTFV